jgi:phosphatidylserine/phosphatidylglycerophosphate/cardiolipin synthase-like enzyme
MAIDLGALKLFLGPPDILPAGSTAVLDDLEAAIVAFIGGAARTLDIAVQELRSRPITDAILAAKARGVRVRLVSEADYLSVERPYADPFDSAPDGDQEVNRVLHAALLRAKIWVRTDYNPAIFHQKFIVRDKSAVLTGSANFTDTDCHANLNHLVIIDSADVARAFDDEFDEISKGHFGKFNTGIDRSPPEILVANVRVKPCFAPDHAPEMEIMKQMLKARDRIDFAIFTFANSSGIDDTMVNLARNGLPIRGAMDGGQASQKWAVGKGLTEAGCNIWKVRRKGPLRKLHHKLMVIDDSVTIVGSFNYTEDANRTNDENILVLGDADNPTGEQRMLALAARREIDRIIGDHGTEIVSDPP